MSEARYRSVEVRAGAEEGRLDGYAAVWGAAYEIGHRLKEVIARGAFGPRQPSPCTYSIDTRPVRSVMPRSRSTTTALA